MQPERDIHKIMQTTQNYDSRTNHLYPIFSDQQRSLPTDPLSYAEENEHIQSMQQSVNNVSKLINPSNLVND